MCDIMLHNHSPLTELGEDEEIDPHDGSGSLEPYAAACVTPASLIPSQILPLSVATLLDVPEIATPRALPLSVTPPLAAPRRGDLSRPADSLLSCPTADPMATDRIYQDLLGAPTQATVGTMEGWSEGMSPISSAPSSPTATEEDCAHTEYGDSVVGEADTFGSLCYYPGTDPAAATTAAAAAASVISLAAGATPQMGQPLVGPAPLPSTGLSVAALHPPLHQQQHSALAFQKLWNGLFAAPTSFTQLQQTQLPGSAPLCISGPVGGEGPPPGAHSSLGRGGTGDFTSMLASTTVRGPAKGATSTSPSSSGATTMVAGLRTAPSRHSFAGSGGTTVVGADQRRSDSASMAPEPSAVLSDTTVSRHLDDSQWLPCRILLGEGIEPNTYLPLLQLLICWSCRVADRHDLLESMTDSTESDSNHNHQDSSLTGNGLVGGMMSSSTASTVQSVPSPNGPRLTNWPDVADAVKTLQLGYESSLFWIRPKDFDSGGSSGGTTASSSSPSSTSSSRISNAAPVVSNFPGSSFDDVVRTDADQYRCIMGREQRLRSVVAGVLRGGDEKCISCGRMIPLPLIICRAPGIQAQIAAAAREDNWVPLLSSSRRRPPVVSDQVVSRKQMAFDPSAIRSVLTTSAITLDPYSCQTAPIAGFSQLQATTAITGVGSGGPPHHVRLQPPHHRSSAPSSAQSSHPGIAPQSTFNPYVASAAAAHVSPAWQSRISPSFRHSETRFSYEMLDLGHHHHALWTGGSSKWTHESNISPSIRLGPRGGRGPMGGPGCKRQQPAHRIPPAHVVHPQSPTIGHPHQYHGGASSVDSAGTSPASAGSGPLPRQFRRSRGGRVYWNYGSSHNKGINDVPSPTGAAFSPTNSSGASTPGTGSPTFFRSKRRLRPKGAGYVSAPALGDPAIVGMGGMHRPPVGSNGSGGNARTLPPVYHPDGSANRTATVPLIGDPANLT